MQQSVIKTSTKSKSRIQRELDDADSEQSRFTTDRYTNADCQTIYKWNLDVFAGIATAATPLVIYVYKKKWDGIVQAYYMEYSIYG
jgi:hypothetical protein